MPWECPCLLSLSLIVVFIVVSVFHAAPVFAFRCLPTGDRARVVLQLDQRLNWAEARIDDMAAGPVLHDAIRRMICLGVSVLVVIFSPGRKSEN